VQTQGHGFGALAGGQGEDATERGPRVAASQRGTLNPPPRCTARTGRPGAKAVSIASAKRSV